MWKMRVGEGLLEDATEMVASALKLLIWGGQFINMLLETFGFAYPSFHDQKNLRHVWYWQEWNLIL